MQPALAILGNRKARFEKAVEEVADARLWLEQLGQRQQQAALDLVKAQRECAEAQEAHKAKLNAARGVPPQVHEAFTADDKLWSDLSRYDEETRKQMEEWKQDLGARVKRRFEPFLARKGENLKNSRKPLKINDLRLLGPSSEASWRPLGASRGPVGPS